MSATVDVYEFTSSSAGVSKTSGTVRHKKANNTTVDAVNPLVKPSGGSYDRSFFKYVGLYCSVAPGTNIQNGKFWYDTTGSFPTGAAYYYASVAPASWATPVQADGTGEGTTYTLADGTHASSTNTVDLSVGTFTGTGVMGNMIMEYLRIDSTVAGGILTGTALNFSYDEI